MTKNIGYGTSEVGACPKLNLCPKKEIQMSSCLPRGDHESYDSWYQKHNEPSVTVKYFLNLKYTIPYIP